MPVLGGCWSLSPGLCRVHYHCLHAVPCQDRSEFPRVYWAFLGFTQTKTLQQSSQALSIYSLNVPLPLLLLHMSFPCSPRGPSTALLLTAYQGQQMSNDDILAWLPSFLYQSNVGCWHTDTTYFILLSKQLFFLCHKQLELKQLHLGHKQLGLKLNLLHTQQKGSCGVWWKEH